MTADNAEFRFEILYALQSGRKRFEELWTSVRTGEVIRSKITLVRYLKALEQESVIKRTQASHKTVFYEIMPRERGSWVLAAGAGGAPGGPFHGLDVEWIIRSIGNKAIALQVAIGYAFRQVMQEETTDAPWRILTGRPRYRLFLEPEPSRYLGRKSTKQDWSDDIMSWRSRRYWMFLKALRGILEKYPQHVRAYLLRRHQKPSIEEPRHGRLDILRQVLEEQNMSAAWRDRVLMEARESSEFKEEEYFSRLVRDLQRQHARKKESLSRRPRGGLPNQILKDEKQPHC
jgi:hypothetical protein